MTEFKTIELDHIYASKENYRTEFDDHAIKELSESIAKHGVIQPILVRANGKPGMFEIVCGERRYRASKIAGLKEIPANVRALDDDQAFELRITENLQRKDVHPLDEAIAYKTYKDQKQISIDELSAKFAKPKEYIAHRLAFNNLIPEMKKEFYEGKMLIGHALLFSRLTEADQKWCTKNCKAQWGDSSGQYHPVKGAEAAIANNLIRNLAKAPFNIHDEKLIVAAGSCEACPKRSGHNLLFSDVKEKDRCFDAACFGLKITRSMIQKLQEIVENSPETILVTGYSNITDKEVKKFIEENKLKTFSSSDVSDAKKTDKNSIRALIVAGNEIGEYKYVTIDNKRTGSSGSGSPAKRPSSDINDQISSLKRKLEMERKDLEEKVLEQGTEKLFDLKPYREPDSTPVSEWEWTIIFAYMSSIVYGPFQKKIEAELKKIKLDASIKGDDQIRAEQLRKAPQALKNFILRAFIADSVEPSSLSEDGVIHATLKAMEQFKGVNLPAIREQLQVNYKKSEETITKKIKELQDKKKTPAGTKAVPTKKAPAKKAAKKK